MCLLKKKSGNWESLEVVLHNSDTITPKADIFCNITLFLQRLFYLWNCSKVFSICFDYLGHFHQGEWSRRVPAAADWLVICSTWQGSAGSPFSLSVSPGCSIFNTKSKYLSLYNSQHHLNKVSSALWRKQKKIKLCNGLVQWGWGWWLELTKDAKDTPPCGRCWAAAPTVGGSRSSSTIYVNTTTAQILLLTSIGRLSQCLDGTKLPETLLTENMAQLHFNKLATKRQTFLFNPF